MVEPHGFLMKQDFVVTYSLIGANFSQMDDSILEGLTMVPPPQNDSPAPP